MCIFLSLCKFIYKSNFKNFIYKSNCVYGIYRQVYTYIYKFKYIYVHIQVRQQSEYTLKSKKRETRPFSLGWYYHPRLKGVGAQVLTCPPLVSVRNTTRY
jgi:hypothetical protein